MSRTVIGATADGFPHCGKVCGEESRDVLAGFNGAGMPHIFLTAEGIAKMMRENVPFEESGIPRGFRTCEERLDRDAVR